MTPDLPHVTDPDELAWREQRRREDRLEDLRGRIIGSAFAFGGAFIVGAGAAPRVLNLVAQRVDGICAGYLRILSASPSDPLVIWITTALGIAMGALLPIVVFRSAGFVVPNLTRRERGLLLAWLPASLLLFVAGAVLAMLIAAPAAFALLTSIKTGIFGWHVGCGSAHRFFVAMMAGFGLAFQLPLILSLSAILNLASPDQLRTGRRYAIPAILLLSALLRPAPAAISLLAVALPFYAAYELGLLLAARFVHPPTALNPA